MARLSHLNHQFVSNGVPESIDAAGAILPVARASAAKQPEELEEDDRPSGSSRHLAPRYLFYCYTCKENGHAGDGGAAVADGAPCGSYRSIIWRPRPWPALPPHLTGARLRLRFLFRWALDRLFPSDGAGCGALLVYDGGRLVHYSAFTPRYWRFPFIADGDLQIGDTWTHPAYRRRGLASFILRMTVAELARPGRRLWYVVEAINEPSIRVAEKAGFRLAAEGAWVVPWRIKALGAYVIRQPVE